MDYRHIFVSLSTLLAGLLVLSSCAKTVEPASEIVFTAGGLSAEVSTKATPVTALSSFYVLCHMAETPSTGNKAFCTVFSGSTSYSGGQFWPTIDAGYRFLAANAAIADDGSVSVSSDTDVIVAKLVNPTFKAVNTLTFEHIFARVGDVTINAPATYNVSDLSVSITPLVSGRYTYGGTWTGTTAGTAQNISNATAGTKSNDLWLIPGTYTLTVSYTLTKGQYLERFTKTAPVSLEAGKINNIRATLPEGNAVQLTFSVTLNPWVTSSHDTTFS